MYQLCKPLVKNKRKSMNDSGKYRAIALGSPLSKFCDDHFELKKHM